MLCSWSERKSRLVVVSSLVSMFDEVDGWMLKEEELDDGNDSTWSWCESSGDERRDCLILDE